MCLLSIQRVFIWRPWSMTNHQWRHHDVISILWFCSCPLVCFCRVLRVFDCTLACASIVRLFVYDVIMTSSQHDVTIHSHHRHSLLGTGILSSLRRHIHLIIQIYIRTEASSRKLLGNYFKMASRCDSGRVHAEGVILTLAPINVNNNNHNAHRLDWPNTLSSWD